MKRTKIEEAKAYVANCDADVREASIEEGKAEEVWDVAVGLLIEARREQEKANAELLALLQE